MYWLQRKNAIACCLKYQKIYQRMKASEPQTKLAQKLAEIRQRSQLKEAQQLLSDFGIPLDRCLIFLPNTFASERLEQWLSQAFPWQFGQIDWRKVSGSICLSWNNYDEAASAFNCLCKTQQFGNPIVNVMWFSTYRPIIEMQLDLVQISLAALLAEDWDTWIFDPASGWCVEFYHEGTIGYGRIF